LLRHSVPSSRLFFPTAILHQVGNDRDPGVRVTDKILTTKTSSGPTSPHFQLRYPKQTLVYVEGSELNHTNRTSIGKKHTMDQRPKDKSQPSYPATSTNMLPAQAHPGDSTAPANSSKSDKSAQTQRWLGENPHQEPWNAAARIISEEAKSGESASKNSQCKSESEEEYLDTE
jgi:hypothetical protein